MSAQPTLNIPNQISDSNFSITLQQQTGAVRAAGCTKHPLPLGWDFKQGVDSPNLDVMHSGITTGNWTQLIAACDNTPGCKALNTWGW